MIFINAGEKVRAEARVPSIYKEGSKKVKKNAMDLCGVEQPLIVVRRVRSTQGYEVRHTGKCNGVQPVGKNKKRVDCISFRKIFNG